MSFLDSLRRGFGPLPVPLQTNWNIRQTRILEQREARVQARTIADLDPGSASLDDLLLRVQGINPRPWRAASITEALGVPAIHGAVNLIANITGSLSMRALRNEVELAPADRPRVIIRPDPFTIPREFYRTTGYNLASRGEAWWWAAARDIDGMAISVINVNPAEVTVEEDPDDLRYPIIRWRGVKMRNEDFRQLVWARESGSLRGHGPLQFCGAAVSVAVEAQEWAANFYAGGGRPPLIIKSASELGENPDFPDAATEAAALRAQWMDQDANTPRVIDPGIEDITYPPEMAQGAQMLEARAHQNIDVATMFNMDAALLNAAVAGSSLTYQNVGMEFEKFLRMCLRPNVLETIEQTMSDFLPRAVVARFNTAALTLADVTTRYGAYKVGIEAGIIDAQEARRFEGFAPGDVENASVPYSPPAAVPSRLPIQMRTEVEVRCDGRRMLRGVLAPCNRLLSSTGSFTGQCPRCKKEHDIAPAPLPQIAAPERVVIPFAVRTAPVVEAEPEPPSVVALLRDEVAATRADVREVMALFHQQMRTETIRMPDNRTEMRIEQGAIQVTLAAPPPAEVNVTVPERSVHVDAPVINVPAQEPPVVNVAAPEAPVVTVNVPEQPAATITVNVPETKPPVINVSTPSQPSPVVNFNVPEPSLTRKRIEYGANGRPSALIEEPA